MCCISYRSGSVQLQYTSVCKFCSKKWYLKLISMWQHLGFWKHTGEIQTAQSTSIVSQLLKLVTPLQIQRSVDTIKANSFSVPPLGFPDPRCDGGFSSPCIYCSLYLSTAFVATSVLNQALGIWGMGSMGTFSCMAKITAISWCSQQLCVVLQVQEHLFSFFL